MIKKIYQVNNHMFAIEWKDGITKQYILSDLQKACPCANCVDEVTGQRLLNKQPVAEDVRAINITNVGSYALRIQFSSGCSKGLFELSKLRESNE